MQIVYIMPYDVNGGKCPNAPVIFICFSSASNLRCLQATYMKFAEYIDILIQIIYAKVKNNRAKDNRDTRCTNMENKKFFFQEGFQQSVFHCCVTMFKLLPSIVRETGNNILIQSASS